MKKRTKDKKTTVVPLATPPVAEKVPEKFDEPLPVSEDESGPFFRRVDWSAFWTAFLVSLAVYVYTLAPTVTLEDSGELAVGAAHLGVPHPPGYPIWTILTWLFTKLLAFVHFRGQPNPAYGAGFASAFFGAVAAGLTATLICRSGRDLLRSIRRVTEAIGTNAESAICWAGGVSASLLFAFSPVNWSQAVIVEVYSLNAFFLVLVLFLAYVWVRRPLERLPTITASMALIGAICLAVMYSRLYLHLKRYTDFWDVGVYYLLGLLLITALTGLAVWAWRRYPSSRLLYLTALAFGFGLTNYQVLLLLLVSLVVVVFYKDLNLLRDFMLAGAPYLIVFALVRMGALPKIAHPLHFTAWLYGGLNFAWLAVTFFLLPNGRQVAPTILFMELGLSVYVFMPLASETNPPINWGYPRTWEGFLHALTRGQYERIAPTDVFSYRFLRMVGEYLADLRAKFTLPVVVAGLMPFAAWSVSVGPRRIKAFYAALGIAVLAVGLIVFEEAVMPTFQEIGWVSATYRSLILAMALMTGFGVATMAVGELDDLMGKLTGRIKAAWSERMVVALIFAGVALAAIYYEFQVLSRLAGGSGGEGGVTGAEKAGMAMAAFGPLAAFSLAAFLYFSSARLRLDFGREPRRWIMVILSGFLVMSVVLISLASPKGDLQDQFIQRVKFISSHALFSFWIGYGIIMGLAFLDTLLRSFRPLQWAGIGVTLLLPLIPILQNGYNSELIRTDGGAEQNGHDFGWQFGNYQLRGAEAILEELSPDEEPLPNPVFPPEMGPRAVFFGGTDPGRFVPTYMIYCADVRPDVYLITQNALADNTYMSVMRDLYGDEIWIPSVVDGNRAFQKYVEDVRAGRIPASADIRIDQGRVSVQGVGGVMLINGILAQMIFERNIARHDFYVEESYVIQWMYPYLTPHGLIMKINAQPLAALPADVVRDDLDFWDWYTRRLVSDRRFVRDVVARKSFSKLRSAIAGVYVVRGQFAEAERAFRESLQLYPLSPEANFRMADLYMRWNRVDDALRLMKEFARQDPGNDRSRAFVEEMQNRNQMNSRRRELEAELAKGVGSIAAAFELADIYRKSGLQEPFLALTRSMLENKDMTPQVYLRLAQMYAEERRPDLLAEALERYLGRVPADARAWLDLAVVRLSLQKPNEAFAALQQAVRVGGEEALALIREDRRLDALRNLPAFRQLLGGEG